MLPVTSYVNPTKIQVYSKCPSPAPHSCVVPTSHSPDPSAARPGVRMAVQHSLSNRVSPPNLLSSEGPVPALHTCHLTPNPRPVLRSPLSGPLPHVPPSLRTPPCGAIPRTFWISSLRLSPGTSQRYIVFPHGELKRTMRERRGSPGHSRSGPQQETQGQNDHRSAFCF